MKKKRLAANPDWDLRKEVVSEAAMLAFSLYCLLVLGPKSPLTITVASVSLAIMVLVGIQYRCFRGLRSDMWIIRSKLRKLLALPKIHCRIKKT